MTTVLILGAGGAAANAVVRSLRLAGGYRIVGADSDRYTLPLSLADECHLIPAYTDSGYTEALIALVDEIRPDVVHAQPEEMVLGLSRLRAMLPGTWMIPPSGVVELTQDKFASAQAFLAAGVPHPRTFLIRDPESVGLALDRLHGRMWLRARYGAGGAGAIVVADYQDACRWVERHHGWGEFTAATVLDGASYAFQSLWVDGELVVGQGKRRIRWANGRNTPTGVGGSSAVSETIRSPEVAEVAVAAVRAVDEAPHGLFGVDMVWNMAGEPRVTEVNAGRFHTTVDMLAHAGLNLPSIYMDLAAAKSPRFPREPVIDPLEPGILWIRGMDREPVMIPAPPREVAMVGAAAAWEATA